MATVSYLTFPANEQKAATDSILHAVVKYVTGKFPQRSIRGVFVDVQDKMRDIYKNALATYAGNTSQQGSTEEMLKTPRPHLFVGYTFDNAFDESDNGNLEAQPWKFPLNDLLKNDMQNQFPIFFDPKRKIYIGCHNLRIKVSAEFAFTCQNREEQFTIYNYVINYLRWYYQMPLEGIQASFILPSYMMSYLKDMLYGEGVDFSEVQEDLNEYMKKFSGGAIKGVYRNNKKDDAFYELTLTYSRVDFKMTGKPQMDEGNKASEAADNFTVRFPASVEFYIPINYTIRAPELIPNGYGDQFEVPLAIKADAIENKDLMDQVQTIVKVKEDDFMRESFLDEKGWALLRSKEFTLSGTEDSFNVIDILSGDETYGDNLANAFRKLNDKQKKECFKFVVYEDKWILDQQYLDIDSDWNINIHDGEMFAIHTLEIYVRPNLLSKYLEKGAS